MVADEAWLDVESWRHQPNLEGSNMVDFTESYSRRSLLWGAASTPLLAMFNPVLALAANQQMTMSKIPKTGESIGKVGLGTYRTFDIKTTQSASDRLSKVLMKLFEAGGSCIDSSPMYGRSEAVLGELTRKVGLNQKAFMATKVWIEGKQAGLDQINRSMNLLQRKNIDLLQVHNLVDWQNQLASLNDLKAKKRIRYTGITHYTSRAFKDMISIIEKYPIDFIQIPYSIVTLEAEKKLLPLAKDKGIAVIPNQSFEQGSLFRMTKGKEIPEFIRGFGVNSWAQLYLKYVLSHPAVTVVIPGTSKIKHMVDNIQAGYGSYFDSKTRQQVARYFAKNFS